MRLKHLIRHQARENPKTNKQTNKEPLHVDTLFSPKFVWWDGRIHGRWWYCLKLLPPSGIYRSSRIVFGPRLFTEIPFRGFSSLTPPSAAVFPLWRTLPSNKSTALIMRNLQRTQFVASTPLLSWGGHTGPQFCAPFLRFSFITIYDLSIWYIQLLGFMGALWKSWP